MNEKRDDIEEGRDDAVRERVWLGFQRWLILLLLLGIFILLLR